VRVNRAAQVQTNLPYEICLCVDKYEGRQRSRFRNVDDKLHTIDILCREQAKKIYWFSYTRILRVGTEGQRPRIVLSHVEVLRPYEFSSTTTFINDYY